MNPQLQDGAPAGTLFKCQDNGWMTVELFSEWMAHFIQFAKPDKDPNKKILLILDGHVSHTQNLTALQMAREAGIIMLSLPSHTTHRMQPLDIAFFRPLSSYYGQEADKWIRHNPGRSLTHFQVCQLFGRAYNKAASLETASGGFRNAGIWPVDRSVFKDCDFAPSEVTHVELTAEEPAQSSATTTSLVPVESAILQPADSRSFTGGLQITNDTGATLNIEYITELPNDDTGIQSDPAILTTVNLPSDPTLADPELPTPLPGAAARNQDIEIEYVCILFVYIIDVCIPFCLFYPVRFIQV